MLAFGMKLYFSRLGRDDCAGEKKKKKKGQKCLLAKSNPRDLLQAARIRLYFKKEDEDEKKGKCCKVDVRNADFFF